MTFNFELLASYAPLFLHGLMLTALCSGAAAAIAATLGIPVALALLSPVRLVSHAARTYVEVMRGMPALLVLFLLYYGGPSVGVSLDPLSAGILGLGAYSAAYFAEIFRAGFQSISRGQIEAASMLGFARWKIITQIELPQMRGLIIPPAVNQVIALIKDSALLSMLTIADLTKAATQMANETFAFVEPFVAVALLYWILNALVAAIGEHFEKRARRYQ